MLYPVRQKIQLTVSISLMVTISPFLLGIFFLPVTPIPWYQFLLHLSIRSSEHNENFQFLYYTGLSLWGSDTSKRNTVAYIPRMSLDYHWLKSLMQFLSIGLFHWTEKGVMIGRRNSNFTQEFVILYGRSPFRLFFFFFCIFIGQSNCSEIPQFQRVSS